MATKILANQKKDLVRRFVIDVLKNRIVKLHNDRMKVLRDNITKFFTPEVIEAYKVILNIWKKNESGATFLGFDLFCSNDNYTKTVETGLMVDTMFMVDVGSYEPRITIDAQDVGINGDDCIIELPVEIAGYDITVDQLDAFMPHRVEQKFRTIECKIEHDLRKLARSAYESIKDLRTVEAISENYPELIPYMSKEHTDLASLANCMRTRDDC